MNVILFNGVGTNVPTDVDDPRRPENFAVCPSLLTQPAADRRTPLHLSEPFLARIRHVPVRIAMLENAGHYPLEQPGLSQMVDTIDGFYREVTARRVPPRTLS
ncbi:hypothetical protein [Burkholderia cepacia]|uniref:hypothetical protein n=1 Tax=Burkholderia cepacia TaxID=292 RepID=UPI00249F6751|nr:hypothetical protein [Burkholderia cepacia]